MVGIFPEQSFPPLGRGCRSLEEPQSHELPTLSHLGLATLRQDKNRSPGAGPAGSSSAGTVKARQVHQAFSQTPGRECILTVSLFKLLTSYLSCLLLSLTENVPEGEGGFTFLCTQEVGLSAPILVLPFAIHLWAS